MPALVRTDVTGRVAWLGTVADRAAALSSTPNDALQLRFAGPVGEDHGGLTRDSCSRVMTQYSRGTTIRNVRQLSVVSQEEIDAIAVDIGTDEFDPAWIGATLVVSGIPDFTHLPPSSRLQSEEDGATIVVDMENRPCHLPAAVIEADAPGRGKAFKAAAAGRRGITAWVEREGVFRLGDILRLHVPDQRPWRGI